MLSPTKGDPMSTHKHSTHYPGKCEPGSMGSLTCPVCAPYYRAEMELLKANDAARRAKYGRLSCPDCGKVYRVEAGVVEDHATTCRPASANAVWSL
jgi:uncharacterized protein YbaR (Trm112 family)